MLPKLRGICPNGVTRQDECICVQLGSSHGGDSLNFLSVSGEVTGLLVGSVVGSPGAVARISGSSADRVAGSPGDIVGPLSGTGGSHGLHHAQFSCPFLQDSQPQWGSIGEGGKRPHGQSQLMNASCQKAQFVRLWQVGLFCPILEGLGIR